MVVVFRCLSLRVSAARETRPEPPAGRQTRATPRPGTATPSSVQCRAVWRLCTCHVAVATNTSQGDYNQRIHTLSVCQLLALKVPLTFPWTQT